MTFAVRRTLQRPHLPHASHLGGSKFLERCVPEEPCCEILSSILEVGWRCRGDVQVPDCDMVEGTQGSLASPGQDSRRLAAAIGREGKYLRGHPRAVLQSRVTSCQGTLQDTMYPSAVPRVLLT